MDIEGKTMLSGRLEKWAYFFRKEGQIDEENEMKILLGNDPIMEHAHKNYKKFTANDELFELYEAREKRMKDETSRLNEAREEGMQQGMQQGIRQGIRQGMQQGKYQGLLQAAKGMKEAGVAIEIICRTTGLMEDDIENME